MKIQKTNEFGDRLSRLARKYRSLPDDVELFEQVLLGDHLPSDGSLHSNFTERIENLGATIMVPVHKVRKFRCKSLNKGNRSGIRIIYAYFKENEKFLFIDIYHHGTDNRDNHDPVIIAKYCSQKTCPL